MTEQSERPPSAAAPESQARIAISPEVVLTQRTIGRRKMAIAHHTALGKFFQLGADEYAIAQLLDGKRTLSDIIPILKARGVDWKAQEIAEFIARLVQHRIAETSAEPDPERDAELGPHASTETAAAEQPTPSSRDARHPLGKFYWVPRGMSLLISQRFPLLNGDAIASTLERWFGGVFSAVGMAYWLGLVLSGLLIVSFHADEFAQEFRRLFDSGIWIVVLLFWGLSKILHELGHAVAARYHGVRVGKMGVMLFMCAPLAYVDVTAAWKLKKRWTRIQIALAGIYVELALASLAAWCWWWLPDGYARHLAAQMVLVAGPATLLVNANPLLRLDGYYVLSDLTDIPNLRMHGRQQLVALLERALLKIPRPASLLSGWRRHFATAHAICSVIFQVVWMAGLIIGVIQWAEGLGLILAISAALLWGILPLARWMRRIWSLSPGVPWYRKSPRRRLLICTAFVAFWGYEICADTSPFARRVPVVVQFYQEQIARASTDSFVQAIYVTRGQRVENGTLLLELDDPELMLQREEKASEVKVAQLRSVQLHKQGELSKAAAEAENAASLQRQLEELDQQLAGLRVIALRDGIVDGEFEQLLGRFVQRGEELLRVSDPQEKEVLAAVDQSDMQAYQMSSLRSAHSHVRLRGGTSFEVIPAPLLPRARRSLPHPALAATAGGPLPVEPSQDSEQAMVVVHPQMQSRTLLDPLTSLELQAGQIGTMTIPDNRSVLTRLWAWYQPVP